MGYISKLTAQEAERLLELIEKLQQKGDASGDGIDFITSGTGNAFLSNDGTYKEIESGGDTNPNTIILSFTSNGETMEDDQYALLVDSCDNNKKLKVDFLGDNIVTLDAYAIQRMVDNTITFHTHDISYTSIDHKDYIETIMTWIVKPDKSIKLLYRETSLS